MIIISSYKLKTFVFIINTIGSVDDLIECNNKFLAAFQYYLINKYKEASLQIYDECELSSLIKRTGKSLKQKEWFDAKVIDLSTMPNDNIFISDYSDGSNFATNIKTIGDTDLVYGSIRPYFRKAGFNWKSKYVAGSVYSFNVNDKYDYLWILACICSEDFHKYTASNSQGTKMPIISWDTFIKYKIPYSKQNVIEFKQNIEPLFEQALIKLKENDYLRRIKAKLLSKYF